MRKKEEYIEAIISNKGLSLPEIQEMIDKEKKELKRLISDEGALFIITRKMGIEMKKENIKKSLVQSTLF